jgi:para-nitrobenzyl esterase
MADVLGGKRGPEILSHYASTSLTPYEALAELYSTGIWFEPALATLERFAALGDRSIFSYRFSRVSPGARDQGTLVHHAAENAYIFGNLEPESFYDETDQRVSAAMQHAWVSFARDGVPSNPDGAAWPSYERDATQLTEITDAPRSVPFEPEPVTNLIHLIRTPAAV